MCARWQAIQFEASPEAAVQAEIVDALSARGAHFLFDLEEDSEVIELVDRVVRHLSVDATKRRLAAQAEEETKKKALAEVHKSQRTYLQAATQAMASAMRQRCALSSGRLCTGSDRARVSVPIGDACTVVS